MPQVYKGRAIAATAAVAALALAAGLYFGIAQRAGAPDPTAVLALTRANLPDLTGDRATLERWRGKVVVVNFWASWCPPCREEIPGLLRIQERFAANGLQVVGIAVDSVAKSRQAAGEMGISYPVLIAETQIIEITRRLGNRAGGLPFTVVLDREGRLVTTHLGLLSEAQLERLVKPLLG
jgi:thiol-disulfide isomerase/thioredoxin